MMLMIIAVVLIVLTLCFIVILAGRLVRLCVLLTAWCFLALSAVVLVTTLGVQALLRYRKPTVEILPPEEFDRYGRGPQ